MCITNKVGPPVEGEDFYGRVREIRAANKLLNSNQSLLLSAPRRIGKSSFAKRMLSEKKTEGWNCAYIDLEETTTEDGFLKLLADAFEKHKIWKQVSGDLDAFLSRVEKVKVGLVGVDLGRREVEEDLYKSAKRLIRHDKDTLIVIDELTLFLGRLYRSEESVDKVAYILNWLRSIRQVSHTKVRWMFCGSVGLRNFTLNLNLGYAINDLTELSLDELTHDEAKGLLSLLCQSEHMEISDDVIAYTLDKIYWNIPYFIQVIFSKLSLFYDGKVTTADVDKAYERLCSENYLSTWSERLSEYQLLEMPARRLLKALAHTRQGLSRESMLNILMTGQDSSMIEEMDALLSKVLHMLENDGYLMKKDGLRTFRSPLLREYWYNNFVE